VVLAMGESTSHHASILPAVLLPPIASIGSSTAKPSTSHHAIGGIMAGVITAYFPLIFPIFLFAQNRGKQGKPCYV
ncbi:hypothetical protein JKG47_22860, partial [Acidithiobacillus sp. MC6.1]|nr:hypothetical protein [Acidithiobacillus sp. MC6.1]